MVRPWPESLTWSDGLGLPCYLAIKLYNPFEYYCLSFLGIFGGLVGPQCDIDI